MQILIRAAFVALMLCFSSLSYAQEFPKPQAEHEWLKQFVGEWETEALAPAAPGQPEMKCQGTIKSRMLGEFWVVNESKAEMPGVSVTAVQTIGYDPEKKVYIGTWVDSMMNHLWKYEGSVDETGKILTLAAEGPNCMADGKLAKFRDSYEFKSKDEIAVSSQMQGEDGKWITFMTGSAKRVK